MTLANHAQTTAQTATTMIPTRRGQFRTLWGGCVCMATFAMLGCSEGGTTNPPPPVNQPPVITSTPSLTADHVREWLYDVGTSDIDGQPVELLVSAPSWMNWDPGLQRLSGTAGWNNIRPADVEIRANDGIDTTTQAFTVDVRLGEIDCFATFPAPASSPYILPWKVGETHEVWIDHCPPAPFTNHQNWFAWDFRMLMRDTVVAARAGTVTTVVEHFPDGTRTSGEENLIYVRHVDGSMGFYVHFTQNGALVQVGDVVAQGEPIGLAGDSGGSAGPHLHFVVFRAGGFTRQYSMPISYSNLSGPLDGNGALVLGAFYTALP